MKRRILAAIIVVAMLASVLSSVVMADGNTAQAITKTYADIDFDNWTSSESNLNSAGGSQPLGWAGTAYNNKGPVTVPEKDGKVYKLDMKARGTGAVGHFVRWRQDTNVPTTFNSNSVLWTEFSIKYEGQFVGVGFEHNKAVAPFNINKEGKLERFTVRGFYECGDTGASYTRGSSLGDYQLELGKWYRFVIALDFTKDTGSGAPLYVWMNGQAIESGTNTNSSLSSSATNGFKYTDFWIDAIDSTVGGTASVYIDRYKQYETAALDNHAENEKEVESNPDEDIEEITHSYADINFDNWTSSESNLNSAGGSQPLGWAGTSYNTKGPVTVSEKDGKVYKVEVKPRGTGAVGHFVRWRQDTNVPTTFNSNSVLWTEFSIKYEGQFVGVGFEHNKAVAPFNINKEGKLERFTVRGFYECGDTGASYTRGKSIGDYQLELGKWYRFVVALDFTKDTGSGAPLYVWMNGKAIESGTNTNSSLSSSATNAFKYTDFWVDAVDSAVGGTSSVYIDNYKQYETAALDNHAVNEKEDNNDSGDDDGDDNEDDDDTEEEITKTTYADIDFENWVTGESNLNSDGTSQPLAWAGNSYNTKGPVTVPEKDGNVYKLEMKPRETGALGHLVRWRQTADIPAAFDGNSVLWTEFSIKYEGQFVGVGFEHNKAVSPFNINKQGKLERFTVRGYYECGDTGASYTRGSSIGNYQLELGKWYRFVIALDFTKDIGSGAPLYVWMNGKAIESGTNKNSSLSSTATNGFKYTDFWIDAIDSAVGGKASVYIDNYKQYETATLDNHAENEYESVKVILSSTAYTVEGDKIHGFTGMTAAELKEKAKLSSSATITVFESDGTTQVSDTATAQSGMVIKLIDSDNRQVGSYTLGAAHYASRGVRVLANGVADTNVFTKGTVEVIPDITNYSNEPVDLLTVVAKYSTEDDKLLDFKIDRESVGKGTPSKSVKMQISDYEGTYIKAFCMESNTLKPIKTAKELESFTIDEFESVKFVYPGFVQKAVTFSYDDLHRTHDPMLMSIFSKYGIKATFNFMTKRFSGPNEEISIEDVRNKYEGFDTISHSYSHPYMHITSPNANGVQPMTLKEVTDDIKRAQEDMTLLCGEETIGFVWPYAEPKDRTDYEDILNFIRTETEIKYIRPTSTTGSFSYPTNWYQWKPTCHHDEIPRYLPQFLNANPGDELLLFSIWGHANEFDVSVYPEPNKLRWKEIDEYAKLLGEDDTIWKADNTEVYNYKTAIDAAKVDYNNNIITNDSDMDIYAFVNGYKVIIPAHSTYAPNAEN